MCTTKAESDVSSKQTSIKKDVERNTSGKQKEGTNNEEKHYASENKKTSTNNVAQGFSVMHAIAKQKGGL